MFLADIYSAEYPGPSLRVKKTVAVETSKVVLKENGVNLTLTVVDTPGFGDAVDNSNWLVVSKYHLIIQKTVIYDNDSNFLRKLHRKIKFISKTINHF